MAKLCSKLEGDSVFAQRLKGCLLLYLLRACFNKFTLCKQRVQMFEPRIPQESEAIVFSSTMPCGKCAFLTFCTLQIPAA